VQWTARKGDDVRATMSAGEIAAPLRPSMIAPRALPITGKTAAKSEVANRMATPLRFMGRIA